VLKQSLNGVILTDRPQRALDGVELLNAAIMQGNAEHPYSCLSMVAPPTRFSYLRHLTDRASSAISKFLMRLEHIRHGKRVLLMVPSLKHAVSVAYDRRQREDVEARYATYS
jgi:hypothetical protein